MAFSVLMTVLYFPSEQEGLQGDGADAEAVLSGGCSLPCCSGALTKAAMWALGAIGGLKDVLQETVGIVAASCATTLMATHLRNLLSPCIPAAAFCA